MREIAARAVTEAEFAQWQDVLAEAYADEQVRTGNWTPDEALHRAREGNATQLSLGRDTPGMLLLIKVAKETDAGLVVVAAGGRGISDAILVGSTAQRVQHYAPCPVLVVRPAPRPRKTAQREA